jgi:hypothetical protein
MKDEGQREGLLFEGPPEFVGLPPEGFGTFAIRDRVQRRQAIVDTIHPALRALGHDLATRLNPRAAAMLHVHLPRLDWPREYEPFCTWLALSREAAGYQSGPQLNVGVHRDHVAVRLGWDAGSDAFGRFELLARHGDLGETLVALAWENDLRVRVYASAPWPEGSLRIFESPDAVTDSLDELKQHGVWWEIGRRYDIPRELELVTSARLGAEAKEVLGALLPTYDRLAGHPQSES